MEKISRLKNTFTMASTGSDLLNENLQNFVFDSSLAKKTPDIELILKKDSTPYIDLCKNLINKKINDSQKTAILKSLYAEDLAVIQGPPGTGKSTAIAELIWQLIRNGMQQGNRKERILLTSETNLAVDNAIARCINDCTNIVKPIRFGGEEKLESEGLLFSLDLMKKWVEVGDDALNDEIEDSDIEEESAHNTSIHQDIILRNWLKNIAKRSFMGISDEDSDVALRWRRLLKSPSKKLREIIFENYVRNCNVVGATCSSIGDKKSNGRGYTQFYYNFCEVFDSSKRQRRQVKIEFTTVIQDESSKATPAELVLPLVYGKKAIIIGDHRQLPPLLDKEEFENTLDYALTINHNEKERVSIKKLQNIIENHFEEMEISHFQRLYEDIDPSLKGSFNLQYRMHPAINEVIEQFYTKDEGLKCGLITPIDLGVDIPDFSNFASRYHGIEIPRIIDKDTHVLLVDSDTPEMIDGTSRVNYGEVAAIDKILSYLENAETYQNFLANFEKDEDRQIGIISFYGKQIRQLQKVAKQHTIPIRVSTVDRFQGMERNVIIVSMVRSDKIQQTINQLPNMDMYPQSGGYPPQTSLGFADSPNRLNVALSRAKRLLIIVGNMKHFTKIDIYNRMYHTILNSNYNNKIIKINEV